MKRLLTTFNTDQINKYNMCFPPSTLESCLSQSWKGMPSNIGHDRHRIFAWAQGLCLLFQPSIVRSMGILNLAESKEEETDIVAKTSEFRKIQTQALWKSHRENAGSYFDKKVLDSSSVIDSGCFAIHSQDLAVKKFPELFHEDDAGLVPFPNIEEISPGIFRKEGYLIFAHQFFRRSLSRQNTLNSPFLKELSSAAKCEDVIVKIKLDRDMLGLAETFQETVELNYWWGPKFDDDLSKIENGTNRHEASKLQREVSGISRLETAWYTYGNEQNLEMEELRDHETYGKPEESFGCRYVHSIREIADRSPFHLDGAIKDYTQEQMLERIETPLNQAGRDQPYTKLWRIDGSIEVSRWKALLTHFYRDNPLVGEYLGASTESPTELPSGNNPAKNSLNDYPPAANVLIEDSLFLSMAFHEKNSDAKAGRSIVPIDTVLVEDRREPFVELEVLELIKALERIGETLSFPSDLVYIIFEDDNINFPLIEHYGPDAFASAQKSLNAFLKLFRALDQQGKNPLISYSISVEYPEHMICLSFVGRLKDNLKWYEDPSIKFLPENRESISEWCDDTSKSLKAIFPHDTYFFDSTRLLKASGLFRIPRRILTPGSFKLKIDPNSRDTTILLCTELFSSETIDSVIAKKLKSEPIILAKECICGKCKKNYFWCRCSTILDDDCHYKVEDLKILGAFLTDSKAITTGEQNS